MKKGKRWRKVRSSKYYTELLFLGILVFVVNFGSSDVRIYQGGSRFDSKGRKLMVLNIFLEKRSFTSKKELPHSFEETLLLINYTKMFGCTAMTSILIESMFNRYVFSAELTFTILSLS
jgi:hypothetical protein